MSKRRSDTSARPEALPIVCLDENLSSPFIADELRRFRFEWQIELHRTHFPQPRTPDSEVIGHCGRCGWLLITKDDNIRRNPENKTAAIACAAKIFMFATGNHQRGEYRAALVAGRHRLLRLARKTPGPFFARIRMDGNVELLNDEAIDRARLANTEGHVVAQESA